MYIQDRLSWYSVYTLQKREKEMNIILLIILSASIGFLSAQLGYGVKKIQFWIITTPIVFIIASNWSYIERMFLELF